MERRLIICVSVWNCERFEVFYGHNNMIVISIVVVSNVLHLLLHIYLIPNLKSCSNTKTIIFIFSSISKTIYSKSKILPSNLAIKHSLHIEYNFNNSICTSISSFYSNQIKAIYSESEILSSTFKSNKSTTPSKYCRYNLNNSESIPISLSVTM